ncbi:AMIN domain-containing protein, partial [Candidatus Margulisiibacteriota bacterium]
MKKLFALAVILLVLASCCFGEEIVKIEKVRAYKIGDYDQVEIFTSSKADPMVLPLETHNQIAIIFPNTKIDKTFEVPSPSDKITNIKVVQFSHDMVYVIVELRGEVDYELASIIGRNKVILELGREKKPAKAAIEKETATPEVKEETIVKAVKIPKGIPDKFKIYIMGKLFPSYKKAIIKNGKIMVPARKFFESLGCTVDFNSRTQTLYARVKYEWRLKLKPYSNR